MVRALDGEELARITPNSGAHNTVAGLDGKEAYLAGLKSPSLTVADTELASSGPHGRSLQPRASGRSRSTAGRRSAS